MFSYDAAQAKIQKSTVTIATSGGYIYLDFKRNSNHAMTHWGECGNALSEVVTNGTNPGLKL
jgi:hypothetical protein